MILIIIKVRELLLRISPRINNSLRSYIKQSKECFLLFPNTSKLVKKNLAAPRFSNLLLGVWKSEETLFLVFNILPERLNRRKILAVIYETYTCKQLRKESLKKFILEREKKISGFLFATK